MAPNSVSASKRKHNNQINHWINKDEYSWLILQYVRENENHELNHGGPSQRHWVKPQPTHWLKFYEEVVIQSEAWTFVVQLKNETQPSAMIRLTNRHAVCRIISRL